jgi:hypothetical protein
MLWDEPHTKQGVKCKRQGRQKWLHFDKCNNT